MQNPFFVFIAKHFLQCIDANRNVIVKKIELKFEYARTPEVMRLVKDFELKILEQSFEESCQIKGLLKLRLEETLQKQMEYLKSIGIEVIVNDK